MPRRPPLQLWLMTPHGELQGEARRLERFRMTFELAAPFRPGDAADFRLLLPQDGESGSTAEISGTVRVLRIVDAHPGSPSLFSGEIVTVHREDQGVLDAWLAAQGTHGPRHFEAVSGSEQPEVEVSDPDLTDAYDPLDLPGYTVTRTASSSPFGFSSVREADRLDLRLAGREAIRSALRRGLEARRRPGRTGGRSSRWLEHTRRRAADQARMWLNGEAPPADERVPAPALADPTITVQTRTVPVRVTVRWLTEGGFRRDWETHLRGGGLFVPSDEPIPSTHTLELRLELPSGTAIRCPAQVVAPMPTGAGLSVRLTSAQRERLEAEGSGLSPSR